MVRTKAAAWSLNPSDVHRSGSSSNIAGRSKARQSRELDVRSADWKLVHAPTGIAVQGKVPKGRYSRGEMRDTEQQLLKVLFQELEGKVAKHLRVPGYMHNKPLQPIARKARSG